MPTSDKLFEWKVEDCVEDYSKLDNGVLPRDDAEIRKKLPAKARYKHLKLTTLVKNMIGLDPRGTAADRQRAVEHAAAAG